MSGAVQVTVTEIPVTVAPPDDPGPAALAGDDGRCGMCGRMVKTTAPWAICSRCEDELNGGRR